MIVVVGGGVAGLAAADALVHGTDGLDGGRDVLLLEATDRVGGKLRTQDWQGQPVDLGADAFLARHPAGVALARRVGLGDDLTTPRTSSAHVWSAGGLRPLPSGTVLGAPADLRSLVRSRVLSPAGAARAVTEPWRPSRGLSGDRSVADAVGERWGREVADELVEPLLGGIYAGSADRLSVEATMPPLAAALAAGGSATRRLAMHRATVAAAPDAPVFHGLADGMASLADRLRERLGERVRTGARAVGLDGTPGAWTVTVETATGTEVVDADGVVLAAPADVAASLLSGVSRPAAAELAGIPYASVAVVLLAYPASVQDDLVAGSGMLVPRSRGTLLKAATFVSRKWQERAGDHVLIRGSVGRVDDHRWRGLTPDELGVRVDAEVRWATGIRTPADARLVVPWIDALPQYEVGHLARVDRARRHLPPGLQLTGAAYDGVGVAPCIASAWTAARRLVHG